MRTKTSLTAEDLDKLLAWFHPNRERAAERYEITRLKLIEWFGRHGSASGDELADVVLDRVAKRLTGGEEIRSITFFLGVARNVFLESLARSDTRQSCADDELEYVDSRNPEQLLTDAEEAAAHRLRVACMVHCLRQLPPDELQLIREYFREDARGKRAMIARNLGISAAGLYTRMHRLCKRLAACLDAAAAAAPLMKEGALDSHK